jgi:hypothetical protein
MANHEESSSNMKIQNLLKHEKNISYKAKNKANFYEVRNFMGLLGAFEIYIQDKEDNW